jgi:hypothetical protein
MMRSYWGIDHGEEEISKIKNDGIHWLKPVPVSGGDFSHQKAGKAVSVTTRKGSGTPESFKGAGKKTSGPKLPDVFGQKQSGRGANNTSMYHRSGRRA